MLQSTDPVIAHLFSGLLENLFQLLRGLDDEDWSKSTVCPGWSVKDDSPLLGGEIGNLSTR